MSNTSVHSKCGYGSRMSIGLPMRMQYVCIEDKPSESLEYENHRPIARVLKVMPKNRKDRSRDKALESRWIDLEFEMESKKYCDEFDSKSSTVPTVKAFLQAASLVYKRSPALSDD